MCIGMRACATRPSQLLAFSFTKSKQINTSQQPPKPGWLFYFLRHFTPTDHLNKPRRQNVSKDELITAIRKVAEELGRSPRRDELVKRGYSRKMIARHFGTHRQALRECNLELSPHGLRLGMKELFEDWATIARELKRLPNYTEYGGRSKYTDRALRRRFESWRKVPTAMKQYIEEQGLTTEWADVLEMINEKTECQTGYQRMLERGGAPRVLKDRPMYGNLLGIGPMVCAPTNENGVLVLFGAMAERLGFKILRVQQGFPDVEAWRVVGPDRLQRVRIEVEYQSRNFMHHNHNLDGCDLIVCWEDNWDECPMEVVELKRIAVIARDRT
jgi:Homing endonuclease associated repeat